MIGRGPDLAATEVDVPELGGEETAETAATKPGPEQVHRKGVVVESAGKDYRQRLDVGRSGRDDVVHGIGAPAAIPASEERNLIDRRMRRVGSEQGQLPPLSLQDVMPQPVGVGGEDVGGQGVEDDPCPFGQFVLQLVG
jgi:hypothetical protein